MPSFEHELLIDFLRRRPQLARELLAGREGLDLPSDGVAELASIDLSQIAPPEYRCDAVVVFRSMLGAPPDEVIIFENQRSPDPDKRDSWPVYVTVARSHHRCPVKLVVFAADPAVARWAAKPISIGHPGFVLHPIVLGLGDLPRITDPASARASPELAVLSVVAHPDAAVATAALDAVVALDDERKKLYFDIILRALPHAVSDAILENHMQGHEYKSEFARKNFDEGRMDERRATLRKQLGLKFGALSADTHARLDAASPEELERYLERVLFAESLAAVFA